MRTRRTALIYFLFFVVIAGISAAVPPAFIRSADGAGIIIVYRDGAQYRLQPQTQNLRGYPLYIGDIIQTDGDSSAEIQMNHDSSGLLRINNNSTMELQEKTATGSQLIHLSFGSLLLRSEEVEKLEILIGSSLLVLSDALVQLSYGPRNIGGGIDVVADISVFSGTASIEASLLEDADPQEVSDSILLENAYTYTLSVSGENLTILNQTTHEGLPVHAEGNGFSIAAMSTAIGTYSLLDYHPLAQSNPAAVPLGRLNRLEYNPGMASIAALPAAQRTNIEVEPRQRFFAPNRALQNTGVGFFTAGAIVELAAVGLMLFGEAYAADVISQEERYVWGSRLLIAGGITMGIGTGLYFIGF
ncbi:FecR family protein [Spirochaeta dissipatitropha]